MSIFCNHDWHPRTGMDSGSVCLKCGKISHKECITYPLSNGKLSNLPLTKKNNPVGYYQTEK